MEHDEHMRWLRIELRTAFGAFLVGLGLWVAGYAPGITALLLPVLVILVGEISRNTANIHRSNQEFDERQRVFEKRRSERREAYKKSRKNRRG